MIIVANFIEKLFGLLRYLSNFFPANFFLIPSSLSDVLICDDLCYDSVLTPNLKRIAQIELV